MLYAFTIIIISGVAHNKNVLPGGRVRRTFRLKKGTSEKVKKIKLTIGLLEHANEISFHVFVKIVSPYMCVACICF